MDIVNQLSDCPKSADAFVTIGNFDGLHLGHQRIIDELCQGAQKRPKVVVTFSSAPLESLKPIDFRGYVFPSGVKEKYFSDFGFDFLINLSFRAIMNVSANEFIEELSQRFPQMNLFVGYNFRFGKDNTGNTETLRYLSQSLGFKLAIIPKMRLGVHRISSSLVRERIATGEMGFVSRLLGRPYFMTASKVAGDKIGQKIGFPTLNMALNRQVVPSAGVYFTYFIDRGRVFRPAMTYIGKRPTVSGQDMRLETNIIDYQPPHDWFRDGEDYTILFMEKVRNEKKFHNLEELKKRIYNDRLKILSQHEKTDMSIFNNIIIGG